MGEAARSPRAMGGRSPGAGGEEWYADGLRFACTMCGNCCSGPPGFVWFNEAEGLAMAQKLGVEEAEFYRRYARRIEGRWSLREIASKAHGLSCVFLDRESKPGKAICSLYEARPTQCRTWPFWPENLSSLGQWERVKRTVPCPGMDSGKLVPIESIRIQRDAVIG